MACRELSFCLDCVIQILHERRPELFHNASLVNQPLAINFLRLATFLHVFSPQRDQFFFFLFNVGRTLCTCPSTTAPREQVPKHSFLPRDWKLQAAETFAARVPYAHHENQRGKLHHNCKNLFFLHHGETDNFPLTHQECRLFWLLKSRSSLSFSSTWSWSPLPSTLHVPFQVATHPTLADDAPSSTFLFPLMETLACGLPQKKMVKDVSMAFLIFCHGVLKNTTFNQNLVQVAGVPSNHSNTSAA